MIKELLNQARRTPGLMPKLSLGQLHYQHCLLLCRRRDYAGAEAAVQKALDLWRAVVEREPVKTSSEATRRKIKDSAAAAQPLILEAKVRVTVGNGHRPRPLLGSTACRS